MMDKHGRDAAMIRIRGLFEQSGLSLQELGVRAGYPEATARMSAWQFMKTNDPRISMLRQFAAALKIPIDELISGGKSMTAVINPIAEELGRVLTKIKHLQGNYSQWSRNKSHFATVPKKHLNYVIRACINFQSSYRIPGSRNWAPFLVELTSCRELSTGTDQEKEEFIARVGAAVAALRADVQRMIQSVN